MSLAVKKKMDPKDYYSKVPNFYLEKKARTKLSSYESRILAVIERQTFGYRRKWASISLSFIASVTEIHKRDICKALHRLRYRQIVGYIASSKTGKISINLNFSNWKGVGDIASGGYIASSALAKSPPVSEAKSPPKKEKENFKEREDFNLEKIDYKILEKVKSDLRPPVESWQIYQALKILKPGLQWNLGLWLSVKSRKNGDNFKQVKLAFDKGAVLCHNCLKILEPGKDKFKREVYRNTEFFICDPPCGGNEAFKNNVDTSQPKRPLRDLVR